jgi:phosphatidylglycerol:prolipoprotein diacylglycerol transferase
MVSAGYLFCRLNHAPFLQLADIGTLSTPPGLMLGRLGNFINCELYGRPTDLPWGIVFPGGGPIPRHPSQLYESFFEGAVLFVVLWVLRTRLKTDGMLLACFLTLYGLFRFCIEFAREPDPQLGYLVAGFTMGQLLCIAMMIAGVLFFVYLRSTQEKTGVGRIADKGQ